MRLPKAQDLDMNIEKLCGTEQMDLLESITIRGYKSVHKNSREC